MLETEIQKACLEWLHAKGVFCWRQNQGAIPTKNGGFRRFNGMPGQSDIIGIWKGKFLAIEVKRPKGKVSEAQDLFLDSVMEQGGIAMVVHSVDELEADFQEL